MGWAFDELGVDALMSLIQEGNERSVAVALGLGAVRERTLTVAGRSVHVSGIHQRDARLH